MYDIYAKVDVTNRKIVPGRWFDLWAMAGAIDAICIRQGRTGFSITNDGLSIALKSRSIKSSHDLAVLSLANSTIDTA